MLSDRQQGLLFVLAASAGYSMLPVFTKSIYAVATLEPLDVAVWRFVFATPILWLVIATRQTARSADRPPRRYLMGLGAIYSLAALSAFFGLELIPASTYVVLFYTYPAMVAVMALLTGQRLTRVMWLALLLTLCGVVLTVPDFTNLGEGDVLGILAALFNAFVVALYYMLSGRVMRGYSGLARSTAWVLTGTLAFLLLMVPFSGLTFPTETQTWLNLVGLSAVSTAMPIFALNTGIQKLGAARASILSTVEPLFALLLAVVILGEVVLPVQWLGGVLIILSVILLEWRPRRRQIPAAPVAD